jgi:hypothetical protein
MLERTIQLIATDDAGEEDPSATRDRLKGGFPPGATRRMTTLGMLVGSVLARVDPGPDDALVYATGYAESRALEDFLDSFPTPSPTLFQTSIHPSAVQQVMIARQTPLREFLPLSGGRLLAFHALRAILLSPSGRAILCGGEERGTWLREHGLASNRTFAFAAALGRERAQADAGIVRMSRAAGEGALDLSSLFGLMHDRAAYDGIIAPGWRLQLEWH